MNTEQYLHDRFGSQRPFTVPDHYFDDLTTRVLDNVSRQEYKKTEPLAFKRSSNNKDIRSLRPFMTAAIMVGIVFIAMVLINKSLTKQEKTSTNTSNNTLSLSNIEDKDFSETVDYLMLDKDDVYAYLAE